MRPLLALMLVALIVRVGRAEPSREPPRDRARAFVMMSLIDALELPDDKAIALSGVLRRAEKRRGELEARRAAVDQDLRTTLARMPPETAELERLVAAVVTIERELSGVPLDTFAEVSKLLSVEQQARFLLELRALRDTVRARMQERRRGQP